MLEVRIAFFSGNGLLSLSFDALGESSLLELSFRQHILSVGGKFELDSNKKLRVILAPGLLRATFVSVKGSPELGFVLLPKLNVTAPNANFFGADNGNCSSSSGYVDYTNPCYYCDYSFFCQQHSNGTTNSSIGLFVAVKEEVEVTCSVGSQTVSTTGTVLVFNNFAPAGAYNASCRKGNTTSPTKVVYTRGFLVQPSVDDLSAATSTSTANITFALGWQETVGCGVYTSSTSVHVAENPNATSIRDATDQRAIKRVQLAPASEKVVQFNGLHGSPQQSTWCTVLAKTSCPTLSPFTLGASANSPPSAAPPTPPWHLSSCSKMNR